jgi:CDP-diacylglycerol--serine O-phosphatidyltransferase
MNMRLKRPKNLPHIPINQLIPNMLTMLSLCAGLSAIRYATLDRWEHCVYALMASAVLDALDGRIARLLKGTSQFGAELDSLSDLVAFGVAPAMVLYLWALQDAGPLGWVACLVFACCSALRLARFNVALHDGSKPPFAYNYFTGVPTPAGAGLAILPLALSLALTDNGYESLAWLDAIIAPWILLVGALMVSRLPTFSFKKVQVPQAYAVFVVLGVGGLAALLINTPWVTLSAILILYLVSLPLAWRSYQRQMSVWKSEKPNV